MTVKDMIDKVKDHLYQNNKERSTRDVHSDNEEHMCSLRLRSGYFGRTILLCIAVLFIIIGILGHQPDSVLAKAISICLECVGIG